ncbi:dTMP kinase [Trueperella bialowiezensis]|uniref:Thymidylate kinase n=1 Tax=Trueperella bialowiezensis TaxID=312285 RepID=A0A3S4YXQ7_9ACTO|nr:dTMP kinase [Trueperella bialowiezensis]VEI13146.1 Thymidylate kinase [Trueperella bialowiezensis]
MTSLGARGGRREGLFISFEGGDGSGKSTQVKLLAGALEAAGHEVVVTREPGGTAMGEQIRELLLHGGEMGPRAEALLYAADRAHHVESKVRPALARGQVVITDRYLDSSVAYQGAARELGTGEVRDLSLWAVGGLLPDVTFLLDVSAEVCAQRAHARTGGKLDRLERAGAEFHEAVRAQFRELAAAEPDRFYVLDAARSPEDLAGEVLGVVAELLDAGGQHSRGARGEAEARP